MWEDNNYYTDSMCNISISGDISIDSNLIVSICFIDIQDMSQT